MTKGQRDCNLRQFRKLNFASETASIQLIWSHIDFCLLKYNLLYAHNWGEKKNKSMTVVDLIYNLIYDLMGVDNIFS